MATHKPINILEAFAAAPPPLDYVLPNMVAGTVGALVSPGGAGKSMLALQLAAQIRPGDLPARRRPAHRHSSPPARPWGAPQRRGTASRG